MVGGGGGVWSVAGSDKEFLVRDERPLLGDVGSASPRWMMSLRDIRV